ncbi:hypothetical protein [Baaleninema sp.]|uniref:hypothetical protein n=1 Tax=Baaleninema sp. TaxID=3101197 RepID=UPI003D0528F2
MRASIRRRLELPQPQAPADFCQGVETCYPLLKKPALSSAIALTTRVWSVFGRTNPNGDRGASKAKSATF